MKYEGPMFIERHVFNVIEVQEETSLVMVNARLSDGRWILLQIVPKDGEIVYIMGRILPDGE